MYTAVFIEFPDLNATHDIKNSHPQNPPALLTTLGLVSSINRLLPSAAGAKSSVKSSSSSSVSSRPTPAERRRSSTMRFDASFAV
jgi:hypothetical protein